MRTSTTAAKSSFLEQAQHILALQIDHRVNALGGYGPNGEVIYEAHPTGCPSVLLDSQNNATVTFMSNGSVAFVVNLEDGMEVPVLDGSFDPVEKREICVPSNNVWLEVVAGRKHHIASLINPQNNRDCPPAAVKIVKIGDPRRAMWYCARFRLGRDIRYETAVRFALVYTAKGPALAREVYVRNCGAKAITGNLWTYFNLHGTQQFVYNKELWYDAGLPVTPTETVLVATVPYSDILQIKRVSTRTANAKAVDATCDYSTFIGDVAAFSLVPEAVQRGEMLPGGAGKKLNRFSTAAVAANQFALRLAPGKCAIVQQGLLYVTDKNLIESFRRRCTCRRPGYREMAKAFLVASKDLLRKTPDVRRITAPLAGEVKAARSGYFELALPTQRVVAEYANSAWMTVKELYEKCRAHGAKLADGIELGTRDRAQDMWPKMKEDPGRVRADLVHAFSFMYVTQERPIRRTKSLSLPQKLHGMFPRQYPSQWNDRTQEVSNDNRPYADSPLWLINALDMYIRETGDVSILNETVETIRLTNPANPIASAIVGCEKTYKIVEVIFEIFECFRRHVEDSPYGMAQILYGDWCDPIDMFGTSVVGDPATRGQGKGVHTRLSAHLFECLVQMIDLLEVPRVAGSVPNINLAGRLAGLKKFADALRRNIVKWAWEDGRAKGFMPGFIAAIHELRRDGARPNYRRGETGYTLGSWKGRDFDGIKRRDLASQAYGLKMLATDRPYLRPIPRADEMIAKILKTTDTLFYRKPLGLVLFTTPMANDAKTLQLVGRMGVVPTGCAENGEYHHGQMFMHRFRLDLPGQADKVWEQFQWIMSAMRDESLAGPFETPCTSYASDKDDPHFGKGMYFGLSGSVDWIIEVFQKIAGVELGLHDDGRPTIRVTPRLPKAVDQTLTFKRVIHYALPGGGYRQIPFTLNLRREGTGRRLVDTIIRINGRRSDKAEVQDLRGLKRVTIDMTYVYSG